MNFSARTEYACIAVTELALRRGGDPVRIRSIAEAHNIPSRFLVQILLQLKGAGLVRSTRGASGGYRLAKPPQEITLAEIIEVVDGPLEATESDSAATPSAITTALHHTLKESTRVLREKLDSVTVAQLVEEAGVTTDNMYYI